MKVTTKGGIERDGIYFVIEGAKAETARAEVKKWLRRIEVIR